MGDPLPASVAMGSDEEALELFNQFDADSLAQQQAAIELEKQQRRAAAGTLLSRELRQKLSNAWVRVNDLFHSWDADGNGLITKGEFMRGVAVVGVSMSHDDVTQV